MCTRTKLFDWPFYTGNQRRYDVSVDGQRFLVVGDAQQAQGAADRSIVVVRDWFTELECLVPTN